MGTIVLTPQFPGFAPSDAKRLWENGLNRHAMRFTTQIVGDESDMTDMPRCDLLAWILVTKLVPEKLDQVHIETGRYRGLSKRIQKGVAKLRINYMSPVARCQLLPSALHNSSLRRSDIAVLLAAGCSGVARLTGSQILLTTKGVSL